MDNNLISVNNLSKTYKVSKRNKGFFNHLLNLFSPKYEIINAVNDINFQIKQGEIVGFIGANGAGKSTTIKMLTGILYPSGGEIMINGFDPCKDRKKYVKNIGVVLGQKSQLSWDLPVIDSYELIKNIYHISDEEYNNNLKLYTELLDMEGFINQPVRQLSLGQRMRADIAAALLHSPQIIFFDEPTIGLDVLAKEKIRNFIKYLKEEKHITMIFTTHDMSDIEKTCDRLIIIDKGQKMYDGSVEEMLKIYGKKRKLNVEFGETVNDNWYLTDEFNLDDLNVSNDKNAHNKYSIEFDNSKVKIDSIIKYIVNNFKVNDIKIEEMNIESIVKDIYDGSIKLQ